MITHYMVEHIASEKRERKLFTVEHSLTAKGLSPRTFTQRELETACELSEQEALYIVNAFNNADVSHKYWIEEPSRGNDTKRN